MKKILFTMLVAICCNAMAQTIPSYVPTNGLVGWWPFNGNAIDESANTNNGTVNGATLTTDRFGNANSAYSFVNQTDIICTQNSYNNPQVFSYSVWVNTVNSGLIFGFNNTQCAGIAQWDRYLSLNSNGQFNFRIYIGSGQSINCTTTQNYLDSQWHQIVCELSNAGMKIFVDGALSAQNSIGTTADNYTGYWRLGGDITATTAFSMVGKIDDVALYNRVLSQQEIISLYQSCALSLTPSLTSTASGSNATFVANTNFNAATYQWQSNHANFGWQNVPNNASYVGITNNTLHVNNVQLANHMQQFRVIASNANCIDTSNIASLHITDTCITNITVYDTITTNITIYDTNLVAVTDTLLIHANLTGIAPPGSSNLIKVYPNPAQNHLFINNGNFALMSGYTCQIVNALGQQMFSSPINQQQFDVDISGWAGNSIYFLKIKDATNTVIENRKIVLN